MMLILIVYSLFTIINCYSVLFPYQSFKCSDSNFQYKPINLTANSYIWLVQKYPEYSSNIKIYLYESEEKMISSDYYSSIELNKEGKQLIKPSPTGNYFLGCINKYDSVVITQEGDFIQLINPNQEYTFSQYSNEKRLFFHLKNHF